jgi:hypothetical protein
MGSCLSRGVDLHSVVPEELLSNAPTAGHHYPQNRVFPQEIIENQEISWHPEHRHNKLFVDVDKHIYKNGELEAALSHKSDDVAPNIIIEPAKESTQDELRAPVAALEGVKAVSASKDGDDHIEHGSGLLFRDVPTTNGNIMAAVKNGDMTLLTSLIAAGIDVNVRGMWENTPV